MVRKETREDHASRWEKASLEATRCSHSCFSLPRKIDDLYLPKFSISSSYNLEEILPQLGVREVFTPQADLSGVTGEKNLAVSQVSVKTLDHLSSVSELEW